MLFAVAELLVRLRCVLICQSLCLDSDSLNRNDLSLSHVTEGDTINRRLKLRISYTRIRCLVWMQNYLYF